MLVQRMEFENATTDDATQYHDWPSRGRDVDIRRPDRRTLSIMSTRSLEGDRADISGYSLKGLHKWQWNGGTRTARRRHRDLVGRTGLHLARRARRQVPISAAR